MCRSYRRSNLLIRFDKLDRATRFDIPAIGEVLSLFGFYLRREKPVVDRTRPVRPPLDNEKDDEDDEDENDTYDVTQTRNPEHRSANARHRGVKSHA